MTNHDAELNPVGSTPYHGFREWGLDDWFDFTDEFRAIDDELPSSGVIADRPTDPPEGSYYRATDARIVYRYEPTHDLADGDGWVAVGGFGSSSNRVQTTAYLTGMNIADALSIPLSSDGPVPVDSLFFNSNDNKIKYKDPGGTVHEAGYPLQEANTDLTLVSGETFGESLATDSGVNTPSGNPELCLWVDDGGTGKWQIVGTETYIVPA